MISTLITLKPDNQPRDSAPHADLDVPSNSARAAGVDRCHEFQELHDAAPPSLLALVRMGLVPVSRAAQDSRIDDQSEPPLAGGTPTTSATSSPTKFCVLVVSVSASRVCGVIRAAAQSLRVHAAELTLRLTQHARADVLGAFQRWSWQICLNRGASKPTQRVLQAVVPGMNWTVPN